MKGDQLFSDDERVPPGLPLDVAMPLAVWDCLTVAGRTAWYLADILTAGADIERLLATDAGAYLRWIGPQLKQVTREADRVLKELAC